MPAIITNGFRTYNADNFIGSFSTNKMYLMIGKADAWSGASLGQYTEGSPTDTAIPTPIDTTVAPFIHHTGDVPTFFSCLTFQHSFTSETFPPFSTGRRHHLVPF